MLLSRWWAFVLGLIVGEIVRAIGSYIWDRWWTYDGKGRTGRQVSYW